MHQLYVTARSHKVMMRFLCLFCLTPPEVSLNCTPPLDYQIKNNEKLTNQREIPPGDFIITHYGT